MELVKGRVIGELPRVKSGHSSLHIKGEALSNCLITSFRKFTIFVLSLFFRSYLPYILIAVLNRKWQKVRSVFLCYAGNEKYSRYYCFKITENYFKWHPTPIGIYKQGKFWGIVFATPMCETDFTHPANKEKLKLLLKRLQFIGTLIGASHIHFAGILPSYLEKHLPDVKTQTQEPVADIIVAACKQIVADYFSGPMVNVILLGGNGKVGRLLQAKLSNVFPNTIIVDPNGGFYEIPKSLRGSESVLVDVSRSNCIMEHLETLWPELVVLNETFPEPSKNTLKLLSERGIRVFHLAGVHGRVYPELPHGYCGSVPCCAVHDVGESPLPIIKEMK